MKKKDKNYVEKRKNINSTKFKIDEDNNLYLTLPKLFTNGKNNTRYEENKGNLVINNLGVNLNKNQIVEENIEDIEYLNDSYKDNSVSDSDSNDFEMNQEEKVKLLEKLRTKNNFIPGQDINKNLENSLNHSEQILITSIVDRKKSSYIDKSYINRGDSIFFKNGSPKNKYVHYLKDDPVFQNIQKLVDKLRLIRSESKPTKLRNKLSNADLFYYDKRKWGERKQTQSTKILSEVKEFKNKRDSNIKKLFSFPPNTNKIEDILKLMKKGKILFII